MNVFVSYSMTSQFCRHALSPNLNCTRNSNDLVPMFRFNFPSSSARGTIANQKNRLSPTKVV